MVLEPAFHFFDELADGGGRLLGAIDAGDEHGGGIGEVAGGVDLAAVSFQHGLGALPVLHFDVEGGFAEDVVAADFAQGEYDLPCEDGLAGFEKEAAVGEGADVFGEGDFLERAAFQVWATTGFRRTLEGERGAAPIGCRGPGGPALEELIRDESAGGGGVAPGAGAALDVGVEAGGFVEVAPEQGEIAKADFCAFAGLAGEGSERGEDLFGQLAVAEVIHLQFAFAEF